jgi:hypothetical protein
VRGPGTREGGLQEGGEGRSHHTSFSADLTQRTVQRLKTNPYFVNLLLNRMARGVRRQCIFLHDANVKQVAPVNEKLPEVAVNFEAVSQQYGELLIVLGSAETVQNAEEALLNIRPVLISEKLEGDRPRTSRSQYAVVPSAGYRNPLGKGDGERHCIPST